MGETNMDKELKKDLIKELYQITNSLDILKEERQREKLSEVLINLGHTEKEVKNALSFLLGEVSPQEFNEARENEAIKAYVDAFKKVKTRMEIAQGYEDMSQINKGISDEDFHLEEEGEKLTDEMVGEKTEE